MGVRGCSPVSQGLYTVSWRRGNRYQGSGMLNTGVPHLQKMNQEQTGAFPMPVSNVQVSTVRRQDPHPFSLFCSLRKSFLSIFLNRAISSVHHLFFIQVQHHALPALSPKAPCRQDFSHQKSFTLCSLEAPFLPCSSLRHTHVPLWFPDHGQQNHNQLSHMALVQGHC